METVLALDFDCARAILVNQPVMDMLDGAIRPSHILAKILFSDSHQ